MFTCICNNIPFLGANLPDRPGQSNRHLIKEFLNKYKPQDVYTRTLSFTNTLLGPSYKVAMIWYLETLYVGGQLLVHIHQTEKIKQFHNAMVPLPWWGCSSIGTLKHNPVRQESLPPLISYPLNRKHCNTSCGRP